MKIRENVPISELVTMRIGGVARYVFELETKDEIIDVRDELKKRNIEEIYFLGGGANTFGTDEGFDGAIIVNKMNKIHQSDVEELDDGSVKFMIDGGVKWDDFVNLTTSLGCTGVECLAGIPGTVGAAPVQNIGAYGQEVAKAISYIFAVDFASGEVKHFTPEDCKFAYRKSIFNAEERGKYFIVSVGFTLKRGEISGELYGSLQDYLDKNGITSREPATIAEAVRNVRNSKLPDPEKIASSGSFFKNIYVSEDEVSSLDERGIPHHGTKVNTGWLIENAGLKGREFHGFKVSDKAALVLINDSATKYADLELAVKEISDIVYEKFGFRLEQEPNIIGKKDEK